jgi:hypothetical protein
MSTKIDYSCHTLVDGIPSPSKNYLKGEQKGADYSNPGTIVAKLS